MSKSPASPAAPSPAWFDFKQSLKPATVVWLGIAGAALFLGAWQWLGVICDGLFRLVRWLVCPYLKYQR